MYLSVITFIFICATAAFIGTRHSHNDTYHPVRHEDEH